MPINKTLIIGFGEVGQAHFKNLSRAYPGEVFYKDKTKQIYDDQGHKYYTNKDKFEMLLIATQCDPANINQFIDMVCEYAEEYKPQYIDILTTTPCGTTESIAERIPNIQVTKSTIRGMHPYLDKFLRDIPKHIGGPSANDIKDYYTKAGIPCVCHAKARAYLEGLDGVKGGR